MADRDETFWRERAAWSLMGMIIAGLLSLFVFKNSLFIAGFLIHRAWMWPFDEPVLQWRGRNRK